MAPGKSIRIKIDHRIVDVPVGDAVFAHWHDLFVRKNPSGPQEQRFKTLMSVARAAYRKGQEDGPTGVAVRPLRRDV